MASFKQILACIVVALAVLDSVAAKCPEVPTFKACRTACASTKVFGTLEQDENGCIYCMCKRREQPNTFCEDISEKQCEDRCGRDVAVYTESKIDSDNKVTCPDCRCESGSRRRSRTRESRRRRRRSSDSTTTTTTEAARRRSRDRRRDRRRRSTTTTTTAATRRRSQRTRRRRSPGPVTPPYQTVGCYADGEQPRALSGYEITLDIMTVPLCYEQCVKTGRKFGYFGVQFGNQCFCGDTPFLYGRENPEACNMPCSGDRSQICGGLYVSSTYEILA